MLPPISLYFLDTTVTFRPPGPSRHGPSGEPIPTYLDPITIPAQVDPLSGDVAEMAGITDLSDQWQVFANEASGLAAVDENARVECALFSAPGVVKKRMPYQGFRMFVVQARG
jgi:hypothetical protein